MKRIIFIGGAMSKTSQEVGKVRGVLLSVFPTTLYNNVPLITIKATVK